MACNMGIETVYIKHVITSKQFLISHIHQSIPQKQQCELNLQHDVQVFSQNYRQIV